MKRFPEFLKEQAAKDPEHESNRTKREWISAVERLIAQAQEWLEQSDRHTKVLRLVVDNEHNGAGKWNVPPTVARTLRRGLRDVGLPNDIAGFIRMFASGIMRLCPTPEATIPQLGNFLQAAAL